MIKPILTFLVVAFLVTPVSQADELAIGVGFKYNFGEVKPNFGISTFRTKSTNGYSNNDIQHVQAQNINYMSCPPEGCSTSTKVLFYGAGILALWIATEAVK